VWLDSVQAESVEIDWVLLRSKIEFDYEQLKGELGLEHYE